MAWLEAEGHLERVGDWGQILQRWPRAIATKVATLVKQKSDGTQKVRFIVDMLRSGINSLATAGERIVLPRAMDLINSTLDLWEAAKPGESLEFLTIDIADAFLNLRIGERASAIVRAQNRRSRQGGKPQQRWTGDQTEAPHQSRKGPALSKKAGKEGTKETQTAGGEFLAPVAQRAWPGFSLRQWDASRQGGVPDRSHGKQRRSADTGTQRSWHAQRAASCWKEQPLLSPPPAWLESE